MFHQLHFFSCRSCASWLLKSIEETSVKGFNAAEAFNNISLSTDTDAEDNVRDKGVEGKLYAFNGEYDESNFETNSLLSDSPDKDNVDPLKCLDEVVHTEGEDAINETTEMETGDVTEERPKIKELNVHLSAAIADDLSEVSLTCFESEPTEM